MKSAAPSADRASVDAPDPMAPLRHFVAAMDSLLHTVADERAVLATARRHLAELIASDHWLPADCAQARPDSYAQYLLYADPQQRFSVVSFVWGPGQQTPVHDHTVWGLIGMLRGEEVAQPFGPDAVGRLVPQGAATRLRPGDIEAVSPTLGDVHQVSNAFADRTSISNHVYGANIGALQRWVYAGDGSRKPFVSGYSNSTVPNLWDRSRESA